MGELKAVKKVVKKRLTIEDVSKNAEKKYTLEHFAFKDLKTQVVVGQGGKIAKMAAEIVALIEIAGDSKELGKFLSRSLNKHLVTHVDLDESVIIKEE